MSIATQMSIAGQLVCTRIFTVDEIHSSILNTFAEEANRFRHKKCRLGHQSRLLHLMETTHTGTHSTVTILSRLSHEWYQQ